MKKLVCLILVLCFLVIWLPVGASAYGQYGIDFASEGYQGSINPYTRQGLNGHADDGNDGECTWFAWGRAFEKLGITLAIEGNATDWTGLAAAAGYATGSEPRADSVMVEHYSPYGHVFYVEKVEDGYAYVTEGNFDVNGLGCYHEDVIDLSSMTRSGSYSLMQPVDYIYLDIEALFATGDRTFIGATDGTLGASLTLNGVSMSQVSEVGVVLYGEQGEEIARVSEGVAGSQSQSSLEISFEIGNDLHCSLSAGTDYEYRFYAVISGKTFWQDYQPFTTAEITADGLCGYPNEEDISWTLDSNGTLILSGKGSTQEYIGSSGTIHNMLWNKETEWEEMEKVKRIIVGEGITMLGSALFAGATNLETVVFPNSLKTIGNHSLSGCEQLQEVSIPDSVTDIGQCAFAGTGLVRVAIPDSVTEIAAGTFSGCRDLESVELPNTITSIEYSWNPGGAFAYCSSLKSFIIPDSVKTIGYETFYYCTSLESITIPENVEWIGGDCTDNYAHAFYGCSSLKHIDVSENNRYYYSVDGVLFRRNGDVLISYPAGKQVSNYTVPSGTMKIGREAFSCCNLLQYVTIPDTVTRMGEAAFYQCKGLKTVVIPDGMKSISAYSFCECSGVKTVAIPESVTEIVSNAFCDCTGLTDVYYAGDETQWDAIYIGAQNYPLLDAVLHIMDTGVTTIKGTNDSDGLDFVMAPGETLEGIVFSTDSSEYNPRLSHLLAVMARSAYFDNHGGHGSSVLVKNNLTKMGFDVSDLSSYTEDYSEETPAHFSIARKQLPDGSDTSEIVMITIQGSWGEVWETSWLNNFNIGTDALTGAGLHDGFADNAAAVYIRLNELMGGISSADATYVITGHSQGAATANILAALLQTAGVSTSKVYDYNFACPNVGCKTDWSINAEWNNVFNIGNLEDPITYVPNEIMKAYILPSAVFASWEKYGQSYWFNPAEDNHSIAGHDLTYYIRELAYEYPISRYFRLNKLEKAYIMRELGVHCPVDISVFDRDGILVAEVVDNMATYYRQADDLLVIVDGDEKYVCFPEGSEYNIHLKGTDAGEMRYEISDIDFKERKIAEEKAFESVPLTEGREMYSNSGKQIEAADVKLYVLDDEGIISAEVLEDGRESAGIPVDDETFPDGNFRRYVEEKIDSDKDGYLSDTEIMRVTSINVGKMGINSLQGIQYFENLEYLDCSDNQLSNLDISRNPVLETLDCSWNQLAEIDLTKNSEMLELWVYANQLTELDVSRNSKLETLDCYFNQLTSLDVSANVELSYLCCADNQLSVLDITNNRKLESLICSDNSLQGINTRRNPLLRSLRCDFNQIQELDLTSNSELDYLECQNNSLTGLDLSSNHRLTYVDCYNNQIETINIQGPSSLHRLDCHNNRLAGLDLRNNSVVGNLSCYGNSIVSLDISNCSFLLELIAGTAEQRNDSDTGKPFIEYKSNKNYYLRIDEDVELISFVCPAFKSQSLVLSGQIGLNFFLELPEISGVDYSKSYMTFTIGKDPTEYRDDFDPNHMNSGKTRYGFTCYVNSIQMADTIKAVFHYGDGKTISKEYSVAQYIDFFEKNIGSFNAKTIALIRAIADFGHYEQIYLAAVNGWTIGEKYAEMATHYTNSFDYAYILSKVEDKAFVKTLGSSKVSKATYKLHLDSTTTVDVFLTVPSGTALTASATFNGKTYRAEKQPDGRYMVRIPDIAAHQLGDMITVSGNAGGAFSVKVSALSYTRSVLANDLTVPEKDGLAALYQYYTAVLAYRS